jgi:hypothetical protein
MDGPEPIHATRRPIIRFILILSSLAILWFLSVLGTRFLYSFGQRTAENIAGVDETLTNMPTQTFTSIPVTMTFTPSPSATATYFMIPTITPTTIPWTICPGIVVTRNDTAQGDVLHVLRCEDGFEYDIGPLTKGAYAVSPDDKYLVYAGVNGILYAAKIGDTVLYTLSNLKREGPFVAFPKKIVPRFRLKFVADQSPHVLEVYEEKYEQNFPIQMPGWLSK